MATKKQQVQETIPSFSSLGVGVAILFGAVASGMVAWDALDWGHGPFWAGFFWCVVTVGLGILGLAFVMDFVSDLWTWIGRDPRRINLSLLVLGVLILVVLIVLVVLTISNGSEDAIRYAAPCGSPWECGYYW
jgi:hypothetical protein